MKTKIRKSCQKSRGGFRHDFLEYNIFACVGGMCYNYCDSVCCANARAVPVMLRMVANLNHGTKISLQANIFACDIIIATALASKKHGRCPSCCAWSQ